jgi:hypothetical protein
MVNLNVYVTNKWVVDHTSVVFDGGGQNNTVGFGCTGDIGLQENRSIITILNLDDDVFRKARIMGAFDTEGNLNRYERSFYNRTDALYGSNPAFPRLGDCCGILYGIQGVCHQMANRLILAMRKTDTVNRKLRSFSGWCSMFAYGYYGRCSVKPYIAGPFFSWLDYAAICRLAEDDPESWSEARFAHTMTLNAIIERREAVREDIRGRLVAFSPAGADCSDELYKNIMLHELAKNAPTDNFASNRLSVFLDMKGSGLSTFEKNRILEQYDRNIEPLLKNAENA